MRLKNQVSKITKYISDFTHKYGKIDRKNLWKYQGIQCLEAGETLTGLVEIFHKQKKKNKPVSRILSSAKRRSLIIYLGCKLLCNSELLTPWNRTSSSLPI